MSERPENTRSDQPDFSGVGLDSLLAYLLGDGEFDTDEEAHVVETTEPESQTKKNKSYPTPYTLENVLLNLEFQLRRDHIHLIGRSKQLKMGGDSLLVLEDEDTDSLKIDEYEPFIPLADDPYSDDWIEFLVTNPDYGKAWLGGKGYMLTLLRYLGFPVPDFGVLPVPQFSRWREAWFANQHGITAADALERKHQFRTQIYDLLAGLETVTGKLLGDPDNPLILSVRSGAPTSMAGLMKTILWVGITQDTIKFLEDQIGEIQAWRAYYKLMIDLTAIDASEEPKAVKKPKFSNPAEELAWLRAEIDDIKIKYMHPTEEGGQSCLLDNVYFQLDRAVMSVFISYLSDDSQDYVTRKHLIKPHLVGTAAILMEMKPATIAGSAVACSGVLSTTDEFGLEDHPPVTVALQETGDAVVGSGTQPTGSWELIPDKFRDEVKRIAHRLQRTFGTRQDVEFVCTDSDFWITQSRNEHLPPVAAFRYLLELINTETITEEEALCFITTHQLQSLFAPHLSEEDYERARLTDRVIKVGKSIGTGTAIGILCKADTDGQLPNLDPTKKYVIFLMDAGQAANFQFPPNVVGVIVGNLSHGSHAARHLEQLNIPVIYGAAIGEQVNGIITIDTQFGCVIDGEMELSASLDEKLTDLERSIAFKWRDKKRANPWQYAYLNSGNHPERFAEIAQRVQHVDVSQYRSLKGKEYAVMNAVISADRRIPYEIVSYSHEQFDEIRESLRVSLKSILDHGSHATLRSGHLPAMAGSGPYAVFVTATEVDTFLDAPDDASFKYGCFATFVREREEKGVIKQLTELLIGEIPKDKLSKEPSLRDVHCIYSLTISEGGEISVTVKPGTSNVRDLEDDDSGKHAISVTFPANNLNEKHLALEPVVGDVLKRDPVLAQRAERFLAVVLTQIFGKWWREGLAEQLAVIQEHLPRNEGYRIIVLEGQARLPEDYLNGKIDMRELNLVMFDENLWMYWYGIKADQKVLENQD